MGQPRLRRLIHLIRTLTQRVIAVRTVRGAWMYLIRILERMEDNHIFLSAAGIAFNVFLTLIPIILLSLYILGLYLDPAAAIIAIDEYLKTLGLVPYQKERILSTVYTVVTEFSSGSQLAGALGGVGLLYMASTLFAALRTVLNRIFNTRDRRNLLTSTLKDFAMLSSIGVGAIVVTIVIYGVSVVESFGVRVFGALFSAGPFQLLMTTAASATVTFILLMFVFVTIPDIRLPVKAVLLSSLVATILWTAAKLVFEYYITHLWSIGRVYGSYAIAAAFAVWVYYSSLTILIAAEIGEMYVERLRMRKLFREGALRSFVEQLKPFELESGHPVTRRGVPRKR